MINLIQDMIDKKIEDAIAKGEFDNLPGAGKPIDLNDDAFVPEELRTTYRILKNSGYRPAEVDLKIELEKLKLEFESKTGLTEEENTNYKSRILQMETAFTMAIERMKKLAKS